MCTTVRGIYAWNCHCFVRRRRVLYVHSTVHYCKLHTNNLRQAERPNHACSVSWGTLAAVSMLPRRRSFKDPSCRMHRDAPCASYCSKNISQTSSFSVSERSSSICPRVDSLSRSAPVMKRACSWPSLDTRKVSKFHLICGSESTFERQRKTCTEGQKPPMAQGVLVLRDAPAARSSSSDGEDFGLRSSACTTCRTAGTTPS